jgi:archaellum biogenesis ATPase FlaH|tara:strand:- start:312 stop:512 length:201 start_codon:yes stop_codon:yes gene_type:complete
MKEIKLEKDTIHVEKKNVYGNELIYPVCQRAKRFAILTGQKTLSDGAIFQIKRLGYSVKEYINREL